MAEFVLNRGTKFVAEVLHTAWDMENFQETLQKKIQVPLTVALWFSRSGMGA